MKHILACLVLVWSSWSCALAPHAELERMLVEFPCNPETRADFIEELNLILVDTRAFEGCVQATVWTHEAEPGKVWIYEEWESRDNQAAYLQWRTDTANTAHLGAYITGEVRFLWLNQH